MVGFIYKVLFDSITIPKYVGKSRKIIIYHLAYYYKISAKVFKSSIVVRFSAHTFENITKKPNCRERGEIKFYLSIFLMANSIPLRYGCTNGGYADWAPVALSASAMVLSKTIKCRGIFYNFIFTLPILYRRAIFKIFFIVDTMTS